MHTPPQARANLPTHQARSRFAAWFISFLAALNLLAIAFAWSDQGWAAISIAYYICPMLNGLLALISLLAIPTLKRRYPAFSLAEHLAVSLGAPAIAIVLDGVIIYSSQ